MVEEGGYGSLLKAENLKLKRQIEELQNDIIRLTGSIEIFQSGITGNKFILNKKIEDLINSAIKELKIITPKVGEQYFNILSSVAKKGVKVHIVINDRRFLEDEENKKGSFTKLFGKNKENIKSGVEYDYAKIYDQLKSTPNINLINNPNVKFLMVISENVGLFSAGWLEKRVLENTILIGTLVKDPKKLRELNEIFKNLLPSFMR
ncbi:MAG: hypothetical protein ACTSU2_06850 [Promethearchaeota archaeon]